MNFSEQLAPLTRDVTSDALVFLLFIVCAVLLTLATNRDRFFNVPLSVYAGMAVSSAIPFAWHELAPLVGFVLGFTAALLLLNAEEMFRLLQRSSVSERFWQRILWGITSAGLLVAGVARSLPEQYEHSSFFLKDAWQSDIGQVFWVLAPFVIYFILKKGRDFRV